MNSLQSVTAEMRSITTWPQLIAALIQLRTLLDTSTAARDEARKAVESAVSIAEGLVSTGNVPLEILLLAPLMRASGANSSNPSIWANFVATLSLGEREHREIYHALYQLAGDGIAKGQAAALAEFIVIIPTLPAAAISDYQSIAQYLNNARWFDFPDDVISATLKGICTEMSNAPPERVFSTALPIMCLLGFQRMSPKPWMDMLFSSFLIPTLENSNIDSAVCQLACWIEDQIQLEYVKKEETAAHFAATAQTYSQRMLRYGQWAAREFPAAPSPRKNPLPDVPCVGFYLAGGGLLAHTETLLVYLRGLHNLDIKPLRPVIYVDDVKDETNAALTESATAVGCEIHYLRATKASSLFKVIQAFRDCIARDETAAIVYVSTTTRVAFFSAMKLTPVNIWWSMKYHQFQVPSLDAYMSVNLFEETRFLDGRTWLNCHCALPPLYDPAVEPDAERIRADLHTEGFKTIVGCMGREEKLFNSEYLETVAQLLRSNPNTIYLWTGRTKHPIIAQAFEREGVARQCRYIGWVNTKIYAQVIDVYIDSFPFASGFTAYETMAAGNPVSVLLTPEAMASSTATGIMPVYRGQTGSPTEKADVKAMFTATDGTSLLPFTETVEAYAAHSNRLIREPAFRALAGQAGKAFAEKYLRDEKRFAETTCANILSILSSAGKP